MAWTPCWIGSSRATPARPSATAARATATATVADTSRRLSTGGSRGAPRVVASESPATASAVAASMRSLTLRARTTDTPRPRPGKTRALLAWAIREVVSSGTTGAKGAAGGDQGPAVGPGDQVGRQPLGPGGRVGQGHDHRPLGVGGQLADDRLGERAGLGGGADQHGRVDVADNVGQRGALAGAGAGPAGDLGRRPGVGPLEVQQPVGPVVGEQALAAPAREPPGGLPPVHA